MDQLNFEAKDLKIEQKAQRGEILKDGRRITREPGQLCVYVDDILAFSIPMPSNEWHVMNESSDGRFLILSAFDLIIVDLEERRVMTRSSIKGVYGATRYSKYYALGPPGILYMLQSNTMLVISYASGDIKIVKHHHSSLFSRSRFITSNGVSKLVVHGDAAIMVDIETWDTVTLIPLPGAGSQDIDIVFPVPHICIAYNRDDDFYYVININKPIPFNWEHPEFHKKKGQGMVFTPDGAVWFGGYGYSINGVATKAIQASPTAMKIPTIAYHDRRAKELSIEPTVSGNIRVFDLRKTEYKTMFIAIDVGRGTDGVMALNNNIMEIDTGLQFHNLIFPDSIFFYCICSHVYRTPDGKTKWMRLMSNFVLQTYDTWPASLIKIDSEDAGVSIEIARKWMEKTGSNDIDKFTLPILVWCHNITEPIPGKNYKAALELYQSLLMRMASMMAVEVGLI